MHVSIIIPAYNEEKTIGATLESLSKQDYRDFEIIVVNNNSTDKTAEVAKKYADKVIFEKKQGYHHAVNCGVKESIAPIITICDADTLYPPHWLTQAVNAFNKDKRVIAVYGPAHYLDGSLIIRTVGALIFWLACFISHFFGLPITSGFNFLIKKQAYFDVGGYDPKIYNMVGIDIELGQRLKSKGTIKFLPFNLPSTSTRRVKKVSLYRFILTSLHAWFRFLLHKPQVITYNSYNITSR